MSLSTTSLQKQQYHRVLSGWSYHWPQNYVKRNRIYINSRQVCSYWKWRQTGSIVICVNTDRSQLLGIAVKTALNLSSISTTLPCASERSGIVKAASAYTADKPLADPISPWSTGLDVKSWIPALFSSASPWQPILCSWNSPLPQAGRIHLQSVTGSLSHTSNYVRSLHRFSTLSLLKRTAKALFLFSLTPTAVAVTDEQFLYSVVSSENLCWHCWFWCFTREQILLGGLH